MEVVYLSSRAQYRRNALSAILRNPAEWIGFAGLLLVALFHASSIVRYNTALMLLSAAAFVAFMLWSFYSQVNVKIAKRFAGQTDIVECKVRLAPEGIYETVAGQGVFLPWLSITGLRMRHETIYIWTRAKIAVFIPHSAWPVRRDAADFFSLATSLQKRSKSNPVAPPVDVAWAAGTHPDELISKPINPWVIAFAFVPVTLMLIVLPGSRWLQARHEAHLYAVTPTCQRGPASFSASSVCYDCRAAILDDHAGERSAAPRVCKLSLRIGNLTAMTTADEDPWQTVHVSPTFYNGLSPKSAVRVRLILGRVVVVEQNGASSKTRNDPDARLRDATITFGCMLAVLVSLQAVTICRWKMQMNKYCRRKLITVQPCA